jgi:hypothetical protein
MPGARRAARRRSRLLALMRPCDGSSRARIGEGTCDGRNDDRLCVCGCGSCSYAPGSSMAFAALRLLCGWVWMDGRVCMDAVRDLCVFSFGSASCIGVVSLVLTTGLMTSEPDRLASYG